MISSSKWHEPRLSLRLYGTIWHLSKHSVVKYCDFGTWVMGAQALIIIETVQVYGTMHSQLNYERFLNVRRLVDNNLSRLCSMNQ